MISSKLAGGMGNQMFQISAATSLAIENGDYAAFDLGGCHTPLQGNSAVTYKNTIYRNLQLNTTTECKSLYTEPEFKYTSIKYTPGMTLCGYFQSEKYFKKHKNDILDLFYISKEDGVNVRSIYEKYDVVTSVHIRRGDYLKSSHIYEILGSEYYYDAMDLFKYGVFIIISDDMEWARNNIKGPRILYSELSTDVLDFTLMTVSDNNIISNSTFSWWAAYLNRSPSRQVISPNKWFTKRSNIDYSDIVPDEWKKI